MLTFNFCVAKLITFICDHHFYYILIKACHLDRLVILSLNFPSLLIVSKNYYITLIVVKKKKKKKNCELFILFYFFYFVICRCIFYEDL